MAEIYDSEQEQVEALKRWWKENGTTVLVGLVVGLGGVFGWTAWQDYQRTQADAASGLYQRQSTELAAENYAESDKAGAALREEFPSSGYAGLSALVMAKSAFEQNQTEDALRHLQWVLDSDARRELKLTARIRTARLMLDAGDIDGALALLNVESLGTFQASYDELRADIHVVQGKSEQARAAYRQALSRLDEPSAAQRRVQTKLDDLGHVNIPTS